jgi:hypothetical protein
MSDDAISNFRIDGSKYMIRKTMKRTILGTSGALMAAVVVFAVAQAPSPNLEQLRQTVSRLRGNRIETPNSWDKLTAEHKKYVESTFTTSRGEV